MNDVILQLDDVDLRYGSKLVVSDVQLHMRRGQWIALVGPNASGKTTLLRCAAGRLPPARGAVRIDGASVYPVQDWSGALPGYAAASDDLPPFLTVQQSMQIYANAHGIDIVPGHSVALCHELGLAAYEHELIRHLSLGTRQKLAVVLALLTKPSLLLLDEVFNGLDMRSVLTLKRHLREQVERENLSILLATHSLDVVVSYCDGLVLMDSGRLIQRWDAAELREFSGVAELEQALAAALPWSHGRPAHTAPGDSV